ncbi:MAG: hypothetical protein K2K87_11070 [Lachnospiraceae bacterium]|nr:hypothetical protein [Lachnospiraceae bacterium]
MGRRMELYSRAEEQRQNRRAGRHRNEQKKEGRGADALILLLLLLIGLFCVTMCVQGNEAHGSGYDEAAYDELEKVYCSEVHGLLMDYGLHNSGMNLTKITQPDGVREYRLEVHHAGIARLTGAERESLQEGLEILRFPDEKSTVIVRLSF